MHTVLVLCGGFVLLVVCFLVVKLVGQPPRRALLLFVPLWLAATAYNMWVGVRQAGYSVADETPIFIVLFAVPIVVGAFVARRLGGSGEPPPG